MPNNIKVVELKKDTQPHWVEETTAQRATEISQQLAALMIGGGSQFEPDLLPRNERKNFLFLGAYPIHHRVKEYDNTFNLKEILEYEISKLSGEKFLVAISSPVICHILKIVDFEYSQLDEARLLTQANDFIIFVPSEEAYFAFFEDDPVCFVSSSYETEFTRHFPNAEDVAKIFEQKIGEYRKTKLVKESEWLDRIFSHFI